MQFRIKQQPRVISKGPEKDIKNVNRAFEILLDVANRYGMTMYQGSLNRDRAFFCKTIVDRSK